MEILHLSDIHITDGKSLATLWGPASLCLGKRKFDFIVISGDLTQSAKREEYVEVQKFIVEKLLPKHLKQAHIENIILVPGNHDVCWKLCEGSFEEIIYKIEDSDQWKEARRHSQKFPSLYRLRLKNDCMYGLYQISDRLRYASRFSEFQAFYDALYEEAIKGGRLKPFRLLADLDSGEDFSIHFPVKNEDQREVCFVGLNSCYMNDSLSRGACFNEKALTKVAAILEERNIFGGDMLRIGVWHHGLVSEKGGLDYVGINDLAQIKSLNLQLVLHGHTHIADTRVIEQLNATTVFMGTGTLTAGKNEREDAIGKQFSIHEVQNSYVNSTLFESRLGEFEEYGIQRNRLIFGAPFFGNQTFRPNVEVLEDIRNCKIDEEGVSTVSVSLKGIALHAPCQISLAPIYMNEDTASYQIRAVVNGSVEKDTLNKKEGQVNHRVTEELREKYYESLVWRYKAANQFILSKSEVEFFDRHRVQKVNENYEKVSHIVNCQTLKLTIEVELPKKTASNIKLKYGRIRPDVIEQRPIVKFGQWDWEDVGNIHTQKECGFVGNDNRTIRLTINKPIVGHRYTIKYYLPEGKNYRQRSGILNAFTSHCRFHARFVSSSVESDIQSVMAAKMLCTLHEGFSGREFQSGKNSSNHLDELDGVELMGFFWCDQEKSKPLRVCFGNTSINSWKASYSYGEPLIGHSFRFNKVLAYHSSKKSDGTRYEKFEWLVCIPICERGKKEDFPIGVVTIAQLKRSKQSALVNELNKFSMNVRNFHSDNDEHLDSEGIDRISLKLKTIVSMVFWELLARNDVNDGQGYLKDLNIVRSAKKQIELMQIETGEKERT